MMKSIMMICPVQSKTQMENEKLRLLPVIILKINED